MLSLYCRIEWWNGLPLEAECGIKEEKSRTTGLKGERGHKPFMRFRVRRKCMRNR